MRDSFATWALLGSSLMLAATGCALPTTQQAGQHPPAPTTGSGPLAGAAQAPAAQSQLPIRQHQQAAGYAPATSPVAQVGFLSPAGCSLSGCRGGCNCCGPSDCAPPAPHGYVMCSPAGWNAYGIDPQEFVCDGGDRSPEAIVRRDDSIGGLQPEDTIVHYTTEGGDIEIQASNRTCVYAPRFASVRRITGAVAGGHAITLAQVDRPQGPNRYDHGLPGLVVSETTELGHADVARRIDAMRERNRGVPVEGVLQPELAADVLAALVGLSAIEMAELRDNEKALFEEYALAAVTWSMDESLEVAIEDLRAPTLTRDEQLRGFTIYDFPDAGRLEICKLADRNHAQPGEVVNFAIRVVNVGDSPVNNVVLTDNLTTRLEYVEDSQTCSGGAEFEATENDAESLRLVWKLTDQLRVGESVTIRFRCTVR